MSETAQISVPSNWTTARLADIAQLTMGQSPPSSTYNVSGEGLPFFQGKAEFGQLYASPRVWCTRPGKIAEMDDILLSIRAPVGPTNLSPQRACIGRGLCAVQPAAGIDLRFLLHGLRRYQADLDAQGTGTTFKAVSGKVVREFKIPLPPSAEQVRIADALDELLSDLDAGVAALERVRAKLKHYRAAVLKAAVDGTLTAEWRARNPDTEPARELLTRILTERRRRWEEAQLRKFKEAGKTPPKDWKAKYREPVAPDTAALPALPAGWCWATMDMIFVDGPQNGLYYPSTMYGKGIPILRIDDYQNGWARERCELLQVMANPVDIAVFSLQQDDLVINRVNSMTHLGKSLIVDEKLSGCLFESNMMRARLSPFINSRFVGIYLHSWIGKQRLISGAKWAVNQASINQQDVRKTAFPLPSFAEQEIIVDTIDGQISILDSLESDLNIKRSASHALRQSILRHAFTGRLVPQDPGDEPAAELLQRIAAARAAAPRAVRGKQPPKSTAPRKGRAAKKKKKA